MEEEARNILREALSEKSAAHQDLAKVLRRRFSSIGGVELSIAPREPLREPPSFQS